MYMCMYIHIYIYIYNKTFQKQYLWFDVDDNSVSHLPEVLNIVCNPCDILQYLSTIIFIFFFYTHERNIYILIDCLYTHIWKQSKQSFVFHIS